MHWDNEIKALAASTKDARAPEWMEGALLAAFRQQAAKPRARTIPYWAFSAVAAAVVAAALLPAWISRATPAPPAPPAYVARVPQPPAQAPAQAKKRVVRPASHQVLREVATDFIPLSPSPMENGYMVHVKLPRSALTSFGLPMNEDRAAEKVRADVLMGQDGVVRAIRFVR